MGCFIVGIVILTVCSIIRGCWNFLFAPIFRWIGELIIGILTSTGMTRIAARAVISIVILLIIFIMWL